MLIISGFYICLGVIAWVYFGYPALLWLGIFGNRKSRSRANVNALPTVSIIVAAHNEALQIESKLCSLFACDYPRDRVEILIGSDGSSDRTEEIVSRFLREGVGLVSFPRQQGKSAVQNGLAAVAWGDILIFTDADCKFAGDTLRLVAENFADSRVGLVTARPRYINENSTHITENEGLYLRYETWLRRQESERGLLAMASGTLVAMRKSLWRPLDRAFGDDFVHPLRVAQAGMLNVLDERISVRTHLSQDGPTSMLRMKIRIVSKDLRGLLAYGDLLNLVRRPALAVSLWSHKLLRWFIPWFLVALAVLNSLLLDRRAFRIFFAPQATFYALALVGSALRRRVGRFPWSLPMSFCLVNLAALLGTLKCLAGRTSGSWTTEREPSPAIKATRPATFSRDFK